MILTWHTHCSSGRYRFITKDEGGNTYYVALELSEPQAVDAATYKLNAKNKFGESNANLKLNFERKLCLSISQRCKSDFSCG